MDLPLDHFSASQLNKPLGNWVFEYIYLTKAQRREIVVGMNAAYGTAVHGGIQAVVCAGQDSDAALEAALLDYDFHPADDDLKRDKYRDLIPAAIEQGVELLSEGFAGSEAEHKISCQIDGVELPIIGFVDIFNEKQGTFCEVKTKAPRKGQLKKDGSQGWVKASLPKKPDYYHVCQVAIYAHATGMIPSIAYVSDQEAVRFDPFNCDQLCKEYLDYSLQDMRRRAITRQNLLKISTDPKILAGIVEPDFEHPFYWEHQFKEEAKELWRL